MFLPPERATPAIPLHSSSICCSSSFSLLLLHLRLLFSGSHRFDSTSLCFAPTPCGLECAFSLHERAPCLRNYARTQGPPCRAIRIATVIPKQSSICAVRPTHSRVDRRLSAIARFAAPGEGMDHEDARPVWTRWCLIFLMDTRCAPLVWILAF